jgi:tetrahydromethanopterin S-methyltransferase subunit D
MTAKEIKNNNKERLKNWLTTAIGAVMMMIGVGMIVGNYFFSYEISIFRPVCIATSNCI